jgi:T4 superinfection immunity protein
MTPPSRPKRALGFEDPVTPVLRPAPAEGDSARQRRANPPSRRDRSGEVRSRAYRLGYWLGTTAPGLAWWGLVAVSGPLGLYLLPALVAYRIGHPHRHGILVWNALLGWTGSGWLTALLYVWWVR